jgi:oligoendopeptidase F
MTGIRSRARKCVAVIALALAAGQPLTIGTAAERMNSRMWDLTDLYVTPEVWAVEHEAAKASAQLLGNYKGTLGANAGAMLTALNAISGIHRQSSRLYTYASLKADENLSVARNQERRQLAGALNTLIKEKTAWLAPEILEIGKDKVNEFEAKTPELAERHGYFLDNILRGAPHTLGLEAEAVLAAAGDVLHQPDYIHGQLANSELPFPDVTLSDGKTVRLDQSGYEQYRQAPNRADRKKVFDSFWGAWKAYEGTAGAVLTAQIMGDVFQAKTRHFASSLDASLFPDAMPSSVYRRLIAEANVALPALHRYFRLRQRLLQIEGTLEYYDTYPTMFPSNNLPKFTIEDSERTTLAALKPYGAEYLDFLRQGFAGKWTDFYPRAHKASGAYMNGSAYDVHPYMLLNHHDDYASLSTFAHEWGHAVHTLLASKAQPFEKANYSTFIAESASIANEMLLNDHMVANAVTKSEKLYYLGEGLEQIRGTFFRQTMFAEFELALHEEIEAGRPLSGARMSEMYCTLLKKYYGEAEGAMRIDPAYCVEWAFIPHFYFNFYVYQYATSIAGAALFTEAIAREGKPATERFLTLLRAGGSDYPYDLYRRAGIDLADGAPYRALIARMTRIMDEIESLTGTSVH